MTIRGILLDKDGTILDFQRTWVPINREVALFAAKGDLAIAADLLRIGGQDPGTGAMIPGSVLAAGTHEEVAEVFAQRLGAQTPPRLAREIARIFRDGGVRHSVLLEGAAEAISALRVMGLVIGVATNDTHAGLDSSLGRHSGLLEQFAFRCGCDSGFGVKPEPGMVEAFQQATGLGAHEIGVVGDAVHDLEMGRRAGVRARIGVLSGTSPHAVLAPFADLILDSIVGLPDAIGNFR